MPVINFSPYQKQQQLQQIIKTTEKKKKKKDYPVIKENLFLGNWENDVTQTQPSYGVVARTWNQAIIGGRGVLSTLHYPCTANAWPN